MFDTVSLGGFSLNLGGSPKASNRILPEESTLYDVLILGGGPAGLNSALYAKRKGLSVAVLAKKIGGQVADTSSVENYLGMGSQSGEHLVSSFVKQIEELKIPILEPANVTEIQQKDSHFLVHTEAEKTFKGKTLILSTGSRPRKLGLPSEEKLYGKGIAYCAICDGPLFTGRTVAVAGGGNSAVEAAIDLAKVAGKVYLIHRSDFRADSILLEQLKHYPNIETRLQTKIVDGIGETSLTALHLQNKDGSEEELPVNGLFIEIGYLPNTEWLNGLVALNQRGEILVDGKNQTNVPGIFAAGDITDIPYKQIIIATGEGAKAALAVNEYLNRIE